MGDHSSDAQIINLNKVRAEKTEERRRRYERVLFKHVLGAYCLVLGDGLKAVELVDLSSEGLSFQLPTGSKNLSSIHTKKEMDLRLYFSQDTFLPLHIHILHQRSCVESGQTFIRFGCKVDKTSKNYKTYQTFVNFVTQYAETFQQDTGDLKFFFF